jgi:DNA-binding response OmpR family regulator
MNTTICFLLLRLYTNDISGMKVLIIEDERKLSDSIVDYLKGEKYLCEQAFDFNDAMMKVRVYDYDCVLLDLMLPGGNGLDILRDIKRRNNPAGVIIVSAKDSLDDKLKGLQIGADDYLAKPFHLAELSMRIYAVIRRKEFGANNRLECGDISIDLLEKSVTASGHSITLTKSEYDLLLFFIGNKNRVLSKGAIAEHLSGDFADMMDNFDFIYTHIKNLKAKLTEAGIKDCVKNVYGMGYKWNVV